MYNCLKKCELMEQIKKFCFLKRVIEFPVRIQFKLNY